MLVQKVVMKLEFGLYVAAAETGLPYAVLIRITESVILRLDEMIISLCELLVNWIHEVEVSISIFFKGERDLLGRRYSFWTLIDKNIKNHGCFLPLKLFKHAAQSFYSKKPKSME